MDPGSFWQATFDEKVPLFKRRNKWQQKLPKPIILWIHKPYIWHTNWRLGFTIGLGQPPRLRKLQARDVKGLMEFFAWRGFRNRRELGSLAGLAPTPYHSGDGGREQGISKAGNRPVRAMAIEIAWAWVRHQPDSALSRWYQERFGHGNSRMRCIGIVALARKLLIALWRYLELGVIPEGAQFKQA
jgi:hypothetical protein